MELLLSTSGQVCEKIINKTDKENTYSQFEKQS